MNKIQLYNLYTIKLSKIMELKKTVNYDIKELKDDDFFINGKGNKIDYICCNKNYIYTQYYYDYEITTTEITTTEITTNEIEKDICLKQE